MSYYVAILDGRRNVWGVRFPDFPGCHGGGPTPDAAIADATSALNMFAAMMVADGEPIPAARTIDQIAPDEAPGIGESLVMIPLVVDKGRPVTANISLDAGLLEAIDAEAKRRGLTRSAFMISAALDKIAGRAEAVSGEAVPAGSYQLRGFAEEEQPRIKGMRKSKRR